MLKPLLVKQRVFHILEVNKMGLGHVMGQLYSIKLSGSLANMIGCMSFSAIVLTSCWLIKHDGLYVLQLLSTCKDYDKGIY